MFGLFVDLTLHGHGKGHRRHCQRRQAAAVVQPAPTTAIEPPVFETNSAVLERRQLADLAAALDGLAGYGDHLAAYRHLRLDSGGCAGARLRSRPADTTWHDRCEPTWPGE